MPHYKADLILNAIRYAAPSYKPCLTCKHSWISPYSGMGWCRNVEAGTTPRIVDEMHTCLAWAKREPPND